MTDVITPTSQIAYQRIISMLKKLAELKKGYTFVAGMKNKSLQKAWWWFSTDVVNS